MLCKYLPYFLDMMTAEKGAAENTIDAYRRDILQFFDLFPQTTTLTKEQAAQFMRSLAERCYAPKTQARKLSALKEFCRFLYSEKIIDDNPLAHISSPKQEKPLPKFLTPAQIQRLIQQAGNHKNPQLRRCGFMICLMFACGLRVSEMISLPENAINETKKQVMVKGKGSKERIVRPRYGGVAVGHPHGRRQGGRFVVQAGRYDSDDARGIAPGCARKCETHRRRRPHRCVVAGQRGLRRLGRREVRHRPECDPLLRNRVGRGEKVSLLEAVPDATESSECLQRS